MSRRKKVKKLFRKVAADPLLLLANTELGLEVLDSTTEQEVIDDDFFNLNHYALDMTGDWWGDY